LKVATANKQQSHRGCPLHSMQSGEEGKKMEKREKRKREKRKLAK
jgi:hypothetical protein